MITRSQIENLYKTNATAPADIMDLGIDKLFDETALIHDIMVDPEEGTVSFGSIEEGSPLHTLRLANINGIEVMDGWTAIVMHSSILFLNRTQPVVMVDVANLVEA